MWTAFRCLVLLGNRLKIFRWIRRRNILRASHWYLVGYSLQIIRSLQFLCWLFRIKLFSPSICIPSPKSRAFNLFQWFTHFYHLQLFIQFLIDIRLVDFHVLYFLERFYYVFGFRQDYTFCNFRWLFLNEELFWWFLSILWHITVKVSL